MYKTMLFAADAATLMFATPAIAEGDAAKGEKVFLKKPEEVADIIAYLKAHS